MEGAPVDGIYDAGPDTRRLGAGDADVELECDAEDGGTCEEMVSYESESVEDEGTELEDGIVEEPFAVEGAEECYPFCSLEWWPW